MLPRRLSPGPRVSLIGRFTPAFPKTALRECIEGGLTRPD